ncbi:MAG: hypothetical protein LBB22_01185, partial [Treponema sp.]|nr:hypothetical protein [Treponema sp.]
MQLILNNSGVLFCSFQGLSLPIHRRPYRRSPVFRYADGMDKLIIRGAREHNLKNIDLDLPRDKLI